MFLSNLNIIGGNIVGELLSQYLLHMSVFTFVSKCSFILYSSMLCNIHKSQSVAYIPLLAELCVCLYLWSHGALLSVHYWSQCALLHYL